MPYIDFFKRQAKNLYKDFKTKTPVFSEAINDYLYEYSPTFFEMDEIAIAWDIDEENFTLMNAQHVIAQMVGFYKWENLIHASDAELELAKLLFDNQDRVFLEEWDIYLTIAQREAKTLFSPEDKLEIFKLVAMKWDPAENRWPDYRLKRVAA